MESALQAERMTNKSFVQHQQHASHSKENKESAKKSAKAPESSSSTKSRRVIINESRNVTTGSKEKQARKNDRMIRSTPSKSSSSVKKSISSSTTSTPSSSLRRAKFKPSTKHHHPLETPKTYCLKIIRNQLLQKLLTIPISIIVLFILKKIFAQHKSLEYFFIWMEQHPNKGMAAYLIIYPFHMLVFLPGTPLVMGAGYIFMIRFGWFWGVSLCSIITLLGSLIGSIMCFLLGRYCMRSSVRRWSKKYPLFDPIDAGTCM